MRRRWGAAVRRGQRQRHARKASAARLGRVLWWGCVGLVGAVGLAGSCVLMPLAAVISTAAIAGAIGVAAHRLIPIWAGSARKLRSGSAATAAAAAAMGLALTGLVAVAGPSAGLFGLLIAGAAIFHQREQLVTGRCAATSDQANDAQPVAEPEGHRADRACRSLTDEQLCSAWRVSHSGVQRATDSSAAAGMAAVRADYLDELERRAPAGFARWMAAGPRAASDPGPYLATGPRTPPTRH
jgi:hypothetical protein